MDVGPAELMAVLILVCVLFGPDRVPKLARSLGESIREFKAGTLGHPDINTDEHTTSSDRL